jgi:hypothetical protein
VLSDGSLVPVPDWLMSEVLEPVLHDLQRPRPVEIELGVEPRDEGGTVWFAERGCSGAAGLGLPDPSGPRAEMLVSWADWLQEQFFPETRGAWGEARPACPGHPHPASAVELDGEAWWVCPADGRRIGTIGQLR